MGTAPVTATTAAITSATWTLLFPVVLATIGAAYLWQSRTPPSWL